MVARERFAELSVQNRSSLAENNSTGSWRTRAAAASSSSFLDSPLPGDLHQLVLSHHDPCSVSGGRKRYGTESWHKSRVLLASSLVACQYFPATAAPHHFRTW